MFVYLPDGRINKSDISRALTTFLNLRVGLNDVNENSLFVYICGPPPMIQDVDDILKSLGVTNNVFYEKWW